MSDKLEMTRDEQEILRLRILAHDKHFESLERLKEALDAMAKAVQITAKRSHELNMDVIKAEAELRSLEIKIARETEKDSKKVDVGARSNALARSVAS